jgi:hypothetical protein
MKTIYQTIFRFIDNVVVVVVEHNVVGDPVASSLIKRN